MLDKEQRHRLLQEIITRESVSTQAELVKLLRAEGVKVTQATVSRDINELRLVRVPIGRGRHRYGLSSGGLQENIDEKLGHLFKNFVKDIDRGENTLVIRTVEGHASGVARLLDRLQRDDIVGTLAGEDTIFLVIRTSQEAADLIEELYGLMMD